MEYYKQEFNLKSWVSEVYTSSDYDEKFSYNIYVRVI